MATTQERQEALRNHLGHLSRSIQEQEDARGERERRLAAHVVKRDELGKQQTDNGAAFAAAAAEFNRLAEALAKINGERDKLRNDTEASRQEARVLGNRQRGVDQERQAAELKASEAKIRLEALNQRILDDYQLDLGEAFTNYQRPENLDWPALRVELGEIEKELSAIGPVTSPPSASSTRSRRARSSSTRTSRISPAPPRS